MVSLVAAGALGLLGYSLSDYDKNLRLQNDIMPDDDEGLVQLVPKNQKPSATNIYHNRRSDDVFYDEMEKSTDAYNRYYDYNFIYKNYPRTAWEKKIKSKANRAVQLETELDKPPKPTTTKIPQSTLTEVNKTEQIKGLDLQKLVNIESKIGFNERRNNMPNPNFVKIGETSNKQPIFKTQYPNHKNVTIYGEKTHNNMEPFFGARVTQNTNPEATRTTLEKFTGTEPVYDHKQELGRFFPLVKDPFAVGGIPVERYREAERFTASVQRQNTLPFSQVRVGPGLDSSTEQLSTTVGFHDPWRPIGRGQFKDINEIRVNPKLTYTGKVSGEAFYIPKGSEKVPVYSRKPYKDLSFTNFESAPQDCDNKKKLREMLPVRAEVDKQKNLDPNTIILKEVERPKTGYRLANYPTHKHSAIDKQQTYYFDVARKTIREETEDNVHDMINANDQDRRHTTYFFDTAKGTIREQTEDNIHDMINANDQDRRHTTYYFDTAKETIREQTEDNIHNMINVNDQDRKHTTYYFDTAKETIREQTEDHVHSHINVDGSTSKFALHDITGFLNASINALKEWGIAKDRPPTTVGVQVPAAIKEIGEYQVFRRQQFDAYDFSKGYDVTAPLNHSKYNIGCETQMKTQYLKDPIVQAQRYDPMLVEQFNKNPFTQSLHSWHIPYNPKYPIINQAPPINQPITLQTTHKPIDANQ